MNKDHFQKDVDCGVYDQWLHLMERDLAGHRLNEQQRESITKILLSVCAGLLALSHIQDARFTDIEIYILIATISLFGALIALKHSERSAFHLNRYRSVRQQLQRELGHEHFIAFHEFEQRKSWALDRPFSSLKAYLLWPSIFGLISFLSGSSATYLLFDGFNG